MRGAGTTGSSLPLFFANPIEYVCTTVQYLCHTPSYTVTETEAALRHYHNCEYVTQPLTDQDVHEVHTKVGGNARELRRELPVSLL